MSWLKIKINEEFKENIAAEVTIGDGRLAIGVSACKLIEDVFSMQYIEFCLNPDHPNLIGLVFLREATDQSIPLSKNLSNAKKKIGDPMSLYISNKRVLQTVFGEEAGNKYSFKYRVKASNDVENMIEIDLDTKRIAKMGANSAKS